MQGARALEELLRMTTPTGRPKAMNDATPAAAPWRPRSQRALSLVMAGVMLLGAVPVARAQVRLPSMGETVSASMPLGAERRLGDQIWAEIRRDPSWLDDPVLLDYLHSLWRPLIDAGMRRGEIDADMRQQFAWEAFLIRDRSINAFALPGGYVGAHLGLIANTASRDELVSVMAHELSHVTQRHIARSLESAGKQSALGIAAMILGILAASRSGNADVGRAAIAGGQAAMIQGQLNFSRDMEREADRLGQQLMADAGFAAAGMSSMFDKLDKASRLNDGGSFPYLRSHPLTVERIAEAQARAGIAETVRLRGDEDHELMRARARVLMDPSVTALRSQIETLAAVPADRPVGAGTAYAAALAAVLLKDAPSARRALARADSSMRTPAERRWLALLRAEAALALPQEMPTAFAPPQGSSLSWPRPELITWGQMLLARPPAADDPAFRDLHQALRSRLLGQPADAALWELLARCENLRGNRLAMLRATAEVHLASGRSDAAMLTLQSARSGARNVRDSDSVELAVIDARLQELRRQRVALREGRESRGERADRGEGSDGDRDRPEPGRLAPP